MEGLVYLIPAALFLGLLGLAGFMWSVREGQYDDLDGATYRALFEEDEMEEENKLNQKFTKETSSDDKDTQFHKS